MTRMFYPVGFLIGQLVALFRGGMCTKTKAGLLRIVFLVAVAVLMLSGQTRIVIENGITYGKGDDVDLKLDLARPTKGNGPFPALVFIHGGGLSTSSRAQYYSAIQQAAVKGYVAVTVDYRPTNVKEKGKTRYPFPAQIYDVKCAVRWLRASAKKYMIDPERIGVVGWSSGGYLALMLGLTEPSDGLEGECGNMEYSSRVHAIVNLAGPSELISWYHESFLSLPVDLLGGTPEEKPEQYRKGSPLTYIRKDSPPILTIHGDKDILVPVEQAELLDAKMKEVGASHALVIKKNEKHNNFYDDNAVWEFLRKNLQAGG